jgi:GNAT superfamily N-acetyltransferase
VNVRRIELDDVERFRGLRLRALRSDPQAFASSYEGEADRPRETWETWVALSAAGPDQAMFVAEEGNVLVGLAGAFRREDDPRTMQLIAMWVDPAHRRTGVGTALTEAVLAWAHEADADVVALGVADDNDEARRLFESLGFESTGEATPLPSHPELLEHRLARRLDTPFRLPDGYVELVSMQEGEIRGFVEWIIAERTRRLVAADAMPPEVAAEAVREEIVEALVASPGTSHYFLTITVGTDSDPRGWMWMSESRREGTRIMRIDELVVFSAFRGRGLGGSALDAALEVARTAGVSVIEATAPMEHRGAQQLLLDSGFVEVASVATGVTYRCDALPESG